MTEPENPNRKLVEKKRQWARDKRALTGETAPRTRRLPPGQHRVTGLPVLDLGQRPHVALRDWRLSVGGQVENPITWDWETFLAQPQVRVTVDIHCVTTWSSYDNTFEGVSAAHLLSVVRPKPSARCIMARSFDGYSTNLSLSDLQADDVLLAHRWNGAPLSREHGGPVRLVVPKRYFWKSAKWLRHLTFLDRDQAGYWEAQGYHMRGDPWEEERYG